MRAFSGTVVLQLVRQHPALTRIFFFRMMASRVRFKGGEILHILRRSENARGADNGEKDSDGLLILFTLLTFLHSVSATGGLGGGGEEEEEWGGGRKSLLFSLGFQSRPSLSGLLDRPVSSVHGGCHAGRTTLPLHSC